MEKEKQITQENIENTQEVVQESIEQAEKQELPVTWEYGDVYMICNCGHEHLLHTGIVGGVKMPSLATQPNQYITFNCVKCGAGLTLLIKEGKAPTNKDVDVANEAINNPIEDEQISKENKE